MIRLASGPILIALLGASCLAGETVYSNFGPGNSYVNDSGVLLDQSPSFQFVSLDSVYVTEIDFVASLTSAESVNSFSIELVADADGLPGSVIASQEFDNVLNVLGGDSTIQFWDPSAPLLLTAGTPYWITLTAAPGNVVWDYNNQGVFGDWLFDGRTWTDTSGTLGAVQIIGTAEQPGAVPEPATILMFASALSCLLLFRRSSTSA